MAQPRTDGRRVGCDVAVVVMAVTTMAMSVTAMRATGGRSWTGRTIVIVGVGVIVRMRMHRRQLYSTCLRCRNEVDLRA